MVKDLRKNFDQKIYLMIYKWINLTQEMANELWIAREILSLRTGRPPKVGTKVPNYSWSQYCKDIGLSRQVVDRILK